MTKFIDSENIGGGNHPGRRRSRWEDNIKMDRL